MEAHSRAYGLFDIMEQRKVISSKDCSLLYEMLKDIKRTDLHEYIECFTGNITIYYNCKNRYTMDATSGAGTVYPSGAPEFTPGFFL
jgi:hypothetical protein